MPIDKKTIAASCLFQKRKRQYSAERASKIKLRRHDVYANQSADKKEMLLAQRRSKNIVSTSQGLLLEHTEVASSSEAATELSGQRILKIEESCCLPEEGSIAGPVAGCDKGKNITDHFSVFEHGSSSGAPYEQHHAETSIVTNKGDFGGAWVGNFDFGPDLQSLWIPFGI